jgi:hypothetical protein
MSAADHDLIARARAYVDASNAHDLDRIAPMFIGAADYASSRVGTFSGIDDIIDMMRGFFAQYPDAQWRTVNWHTLDDRGVEFDFVLTAGGTDRPGTERIFFDGAALIRRIEVET